MFAAFKNLFRTTKPRTITRRTPLALETLESRTVMSHTSVSLSSAGVLRIVGTNFAEQVMVTTSGSKVTVMGKDFDAHGHTHSFSEKFSANRVHQIVYTANAGDDTFVNKTAIPTVAFGGAG